MTTLTDNRPSAIAAKLEMRRRVMELVEPAHVFEGFCGPVATGGMSEAWSGAAAHVGCDLRYAWPDPRERYVGDTHRVMRSIDLARFNVFDLDAYGSPWTAMMILLARRSWALGEVGAVVLTDGLGRKSKFGTPPRVVAELLGMRQLPPCENSEAIHDACSHEWLRRAGLRQVQRWRATSIGPQPMIYSAVVFEGTGLAIRTRQRADRGGVAGLGLQTLRLN